MKKIAVLMGGTSSEREVSLASGRNVAEALASLGTYEVVSIDLTEESLNALPPSVDAAHTRLKRRRPRRASNASPMALQTMILPSAGAVIKNVAYDKIAACPVKWTNRNATAPSAERTRKAKFSFVADTTRKSWK